MAVHMAWTEQLIHFIDFEGSVASGILEYGVVTMRGSQIVETQTRLCRATGRVRAEDEAVHTIDAAAVAACAPFAEEFERFAKWRETGPLAAHFANAENTLIKSVWPYPRTSPNFARDGESVTEWGHWIDTGRLYPQLYPTLASAKLGDVVAAFGLQAKLDAVAAEVFEVDVVGHCDVPSDATVAVLTITAVGASGDGYVSAWPSGTSMPEASVLNVDLARRTKSIPNSTVPHRV